MSQQAGQIIVAFGGATVTVIGASPAAVSAATVVVAVGAAVGMGLIAYGAYKRLTDSSR